MTKHIPNLLTLINLFSGCIGVFACANSNYKIVPICIAISLIADFFDGMAARALNVKSELGGQLDSLADMVSFGVLPGTMLVQLLGMTNMTGGSYMMNPFAYLGFIFSLFACLRLAKFNIDTRQSDSFLGLATPAATIFVLGLYLYFFEHNHAALPTFSYKLIYQTLSLLTVTGLLSYLMVSEIPMFALKGNIFQWKGNEIKIIFFVVAVITILTLKTIGLSVVIILYILASVLDSIFKKMKQLKS